MSPPSNVKLRRATASDMSALAAIGSRASDNEPIDAQWYPLKAIYPEDYHLSFVDEFKLRLTIPGNLTAAIATGHDDQAYSAQDPTVDNAAQREIPISPTRRRKGPWVRCMGED
ncbi:hypothetical protein B0H66DRAFT_608602 [Apodospora peruviana]|uniref:Uncharacterized protein n=1 Tax=Apodospora peruviana TaxID=516989 RepID=A0AAE0HSZ0_9PEZI|nr:hypothetical protein B0H66DRAFT_608602 [Apodospora peruviana]